MAPRRQNLSRELLKGIAMLLHLRMPHRNVMMFCAFGKFWESTTSKNSGQKQ
jgi:hypothetical protein